MPSRSLPVLPHWEHVRKQAKELLADLRALESAALARADVYSAAFSSAHTLPAPAALRLSDAQLVVAREYGFASWPRLKQHIKQARTAYSASTPNPDSPLQTTLPDSSEPSLETASATEANPNDARDIWAAFWVETTTRWDEDEADASHPMFNWLRLNPLALAWRIEYGDSWSHDVIDARGHFHTAASWDHNILYPISHPYNADDLLYKALFPLSSAEQNVESQAEELKAWRKDRIEDNKQTLLRWQREDISGNFQVVQTIWTEPDTRRIVRQERRETNLITGKLSTVSIRDRYTFNQPAPAGTFEMPPDKPLRMQDRKDLSPEVWDALPIQERQAIQDLIARSDAGWRGGDVRGYSTAWKFDFQKHLPREMEWKTRVAQQAGLWTEWKSQVESANIQMYLPVRYDTHSAMMAILKRKILRVEVKLRVKWQEGINGWEGEAEFFLRKHAGRYRILYWECPWAEIEAARSKALSER